MLIQVNIALLSGRYAVWSAGDAVLNEVPENPPAMHHRRPLGNAQPCPGIDTAPFEEYLAFRADPQPLVGASIKVIAPTGEYDSDRLVNVGANRWTTRFKLGGTLVVPFLRRHAIKIGYADGVITRYGENFKQFLLSYQVVLN